ncbi:MAG: nuclear transport factor 2 family protein [Actinomycetes bacterium]
MGTYVSDSSKEGKLLAELKDLFDGIIKKDVKRVLTHYLPKDNLLIFLEGPESTAFGWDEEFLFGAWSELLKAVTFSGFELNAHMQVRCDGSTGWVASEITTIYGKIDQTAAEHHKVVSRGSWMFEEVDGRWLIAAEHVSFAIPNPYPLD